MNDLGEGVQQGMTEVGGTNGGMSEWSGDRRQRPLSERGRGTHCRRRTGKETREGRDLFGGCDTFICARCRDIWPYAVAKDKGTCEREWV
jgi:hypothetical protein